MTDKIDFGGKPWTAIPRHVLRDKSLSPKAKGGLVTLLSHDEGWLRSAIATLQRENRCGRTEAKTIMRELVDKGYARMSQSRGAGGRFTTGYIVYANRQVQAAEPGMPRGAETPAPDTPATEARGSDDLTAVVEALAVDPLDVEPTTEEPQSIALASADAPTLNQRGNALAKVYTDHQPMSNFPAIAAIARKAIRAKHSDQDIADALLRLASEGRGVTTESLRVELEGLPERRSRQPDRAREILEGAMADG